MKNSRVQAALGKDRLSKFYKKGSSGVSPSLRGAITALAIGLSTFVTSGTTFVDPIVTQLVDRDGNIKGSIAATRESVVLEFEGDNLFSANGILLGMITEQAAKIDPVENSNKNVEIQRNDTTYKIDLTGNNSGMMIDIENETSCASKYLVDACLNITGQDALDKNIGWHHESNDHGVEGTVLQQNAIQFSF